MKIKLLASLTGGFDAGAEVEWEDEDAQRLIDAGYAEQVQQRRTVKSKAAKRAETAALKGGHERRDHK